MITLRTRRAREFDDEVELAFIAVVEEIAADFFRYGYAKPYDVVGKPIEIELVFGGIAECELWDVAPNAIGFFAVCSFERRDEETDEAYYEVPEGFEVHVNVPMNAILAIQQVGSGDELDVEADIEASLVTPIHEILHALEWIRITGGKTPDEVYVENRGGTIAIREVLDRIEAGGQAEDRVETAAQAIVAALTQGRMPEIRERLTTSLAAAIAP